MLRLDRAGILVSAACFVAILVGYLCQVLLERPYEGLALELPLALLPVVGAISQRRKWALWLLARSPGIALTLLGPALALFTPVHSVNPIFQVALCTLLFGVGAILLTPPLLKRPRYILAGAVLLSQVVLQTGAVRAAYTGYLDTTLIVRNASAEPLLDLSLSGAGFSASWPVLLPGQAVRKSIHVTTQQNLTVQFHTAHRSRHVPTAAIFERRDVISLTIKPDLLLDATVYPGTIVPPRRSSTLCPRVEPGVSPVAADRQLPDERGHSGLT